MEVGPALCGAEWDTTVASRFVKRGLCSEVVTKESLLKAADFAGGRHTSLHTSTDVCLMHLSCNALARSASL